MTAASQNRNRGTAAPNAARQALGSAQVGFWAILVTSVFTNLLLLVSPIFMLQVYDRVIPSQSEDTLYALMGIAIALIALLAMLEAARSRILANVGRYVDRELSGQVFGSLFRVRAAFGARPGDAGTQPLRDLDQLRNFLSSNSVLAFFDAPFAPFFIGILWFLHPWLFWMSFVGAIVIFALALIAELSTRGLFREAGRFGVQANSFSESSLKNAGSLEAMGMLTRLLTRWMNKHDPSVYFSSRAVSRLGAIQGMTKSIRLGLQIGVLGIGAYLAIQPGSTFTAGMMIAGSIIMGRGLAPVEQAIGAWRGAIQARQSYKRLVGLLEDVPKRAEAMELPQPKASLIVRDLVAQPPGTQKPVIRGLSLDVQPGEFMCILGPSGVGKSTLVQCITGVWPARGGTVRLDNIDVYTWNSADRGKYLGYLPQSIDLFDGNVAENISRFEEIDSQKVVAAAQQAHCHSLILNLPRGYETPLGESGAGLSGGQRQRLGLARAMYNDPVLVVLDEPNSNLDQEGEEALARSILGLKQRNA
ncbi:MAG: type I secretion system permease/ATPase, partial [Alphaproteobacteria bacterium]